MLRFFCIPKVNCRSCPYTVQGSVNPERDKQITIENNFIKYRYMFRSYGVIIRLTFRNVKKGIIPVALWK